MCKTIRAVIYLLAIATLISPVRATAKKGNKVRQSETEIARRGNPVLWRNPVDIRSRNLYFGSGGEEHAPHTVFTFIKEDLKGTSPKFDVRDEDGIKWRVKLGAEARPETVATRLVWAVGYSTNEDYFVPELRVENMPAHLHRGQSLVGPEGAIHNARLKRFLEDEKKAGRWQWRINPFTGTRELNGLRVMMALLNNWDLKDENNSVYEDRHPQGSQGLEQVYMVSDLGAKLRDRGTQLDPGDVQRQSHVLQPFQICLQGDRRRRGFQVSDATRAD
jgi:hypothetical protein